VNSILHMFERLIDPFAPREIEFGSQSAVKTLMIFVKSARSVFAGYLLAGLGNALVDVGIIVWFGFLVESAVSLANDESVSLNLPQFLILTVLIIGLRPVAVFFLVVFSEQGVQANFSPLIRWHVYRRLSSQSARFFTEEMAGNLASKTWQSGQSAAEVCNQLVSIVWTNIVFLVSTFMVLISLNFGYAPILIVWVVLFGMLVRWFVPEARNRSRISAQQSNIANGDLVDEYANAQLLKAYIPIMHQHDYMERSLRNFVDSAKSFLRIISISRISVELVNSTGLASIVVVTVWLWSTGDITVGQGAMVLGFGLRLDAYFGGLLGQLTALFRSYGVFQASMDAFRKPVEIVFPRPGLGLDATPPAVSFAKVTFGYIRSDKILQDISFDIAAGETVGIVGPSGAGKSTIASLLLRFYDPGTGVVKLGSHNLREVAEASLRASVGYVSQDSSLLHRSIRDNLLIAKPGAADIEIIAALKQAIAWDFVAEATDAKGHRGLDILVGERGLQLSGGQRQRIALARAFLKQPQLLILDEATSALDPTLDAEVNRSIRQHFREKTVLTIAHRLSSITWVDRIIVIQDGRVAETGRFDELLLKTDGAFRKLWQDQEMATSDDLQV
jgi:ATP-binding cassette, subfamily B, multidrug efflux pump